MIKPLDPVFQRGDEFSASIFGFSSCEKEAVVYWPLLGAFLIPQVTLMVLNFNVSVMKDGIARVINELAE